MLYGSTMTSLLCKAEKKLGSQNSNFVIVKHHGNQSCELKPKKLDINFDKALKDGIQKAHHDFKKNFFYTLKKRNPWKYLMNLPMI